MVGVGIAHGGRHSLGDQLSVVCGMRRALNTSLLNE